MKNDFRARSHPAWWAFALHRLSGVLLALFLPAHFWSLGHALEGAAALDGVLQLAHISRPGVSHPRSACAV